MTDVPTEVQLAPGRPTDDDSWLPPITLMHEQSGMTIVVAEEAEGFVEGISDDSWEQIVKTVAGAAAQHDAEAKADRLAAALREIAEECEGAVDKDVDFGPALAVIETRAREALAEPADAGPGATVILTLRDSPPPADVGVGQGGSVDIRLESHPPFPMQEGGAQPTTAQHLALIAMNALTAAATGEEPGA